MDDTCFAIGFGTDGTPYRSELDFIDPYDQVIQDAVAFRGDCAAALDYWFEHDRFDDPDRELLRVEISGRVEQTFPEDFSHRIWTGEVHYTEPWEGGRARIIVLDHVPSVPAD